MSIRLKSFEGKNIGRHRVIKKSVSGNVLGLWGVSGSGKSTVLQLLEWLVNGKIEHPDPIADFVRKSDSEDIKKMEGTSLWEVDGKPLQVDRSQSVAGTGTRSIFWDKQADGKWGVKETKAAGADALMTELVGANQKAISSIVFIRQGAFGKLFSGLDSDRRDFFVRLLMLGHLEKIAGIIEVYRKQLTGDTDLASLRDQSEEAYLQAVAYFEESERELSLTRSYTKEVQAGAEISGLFDQLASRETDFNSAAAAMAAGMAPLGLTLQADPAWSEATNKELADIAEELTALSRRKRARSNYESKASALRSDISAATAWLDKKDRLDALNGKLAAIGSADLANDPRAAIAGIDKSLAARRRLEVASGPIADLEREAAYANATEVSAESAKNEAYSAWGKASESLAKVDSDLKAAQDLQEALSGHCGEAQCQACGSKEPDPAFLQRVISSLVTAVTEANATVAPLKAAFDNAATLHRAAVVAANAARSNLSAAEHELYQAKAAVELLGPLPSDAEMLAERAKVEATIPAYDEARTMRTHITAQIGEISLGSESHTVESLGALKSELETIVSVLATAAPMTDLDAMETGLTARRGQLDPVRERMAGLVAEHDRANKAYHAVRDRMSQSYDTYTRECPKFMQKLAELGNVATHDNAKMVLVELRELQSDHDTKKGRMAAAEVSMRSAGTSLQEIDTRIAEQKNRIIISQELTAVRSAFLPSGITAEYLSHQFQRIAMAAQDHLAQMSADFMVVASEERALSFDFVRLNEPGSSWLGQNRMSGGQQVKLAIAVLLAIHELVIPQVGLLVLDEPSTHLDYDSRVALAEVLKDIGSRGNFQLIVCDHSPELRDAYTDEIELNSDPS